MAGSTKYSDIDLTKYKDGYKPSSVVTDAIGKKTQAENAVSSHGDFAYSKQGDMDAVLNKILNRKDFSYDINGDALYQQYKDKYITQGKTAMMDATGQAAALSEGYGNSYASTVGNQAYQASLQNLNDVIPELYQLALERHNMETNDLQGKYSLLAADKNTEYGMWGDKRNQLISDRDYYATAADNAYAKEYGEFNDSFNRDFNQYWKESDLGYQKERDEISDEQWLKNFDEGVREYEKTLQYQKDRDTVKDSQWAQEFEFAKNPNGTAGSDSNSGSSSGSDASGSSGIDTSTDTGTLWYATGTYDTNGNPVFRNSEGKTQAFGEGINPYTGTKNPDKKYGTFSNGYQPNNINGTKLTNTGMTTNVTGKNQTIWQADGKYYLWRGELNKYVEVDISDLD